MGLFTMVEVEIFACSQTDCISHDYIFQVTAFLSWLCVCTIRFEPDETTDKEANQTEQGTINSENESPVVSHETVKHVDEPSQVQDEKDLLEE